MKKYLTKPNIAIGVIVIMSAVALVYYLFFFNQRPGSNPYYDEAETLYTVKEYSTALSKYKEAINHDPLNTEAYLKAAEIMELKGDTVEALDILLSGNEFAEKQAKLHNEIAKTYMELGEYANALSFAKKAAKNSTNIEYKKNYISYLYVNEQIEKGLNEAKNISSSDSTQNEYIKALANFRDPKTAYNHAEKANSNDPESKYTQLMQAIDIELKDEEKQIESRMKVADFIFLQEDFALAMPILRNVRENNQYYEGSYIYEAYILQQYGKYAESIKLLDAAALYAPQNADIFRLLANAYLNQNELEKAKENISKADQINPENLEIKHLEYQILEKQKDYASALVIVDWFLTQDSEDYEFIKFKSILLHDLEDYDKLVDFTQSYEDDENLSEEQRAELKAFEAFALLKTGETAKATEEIKLAEKLSSTNAYVQYFYSLIDRENGNVDDAANRLENAIEYDTEGIVSSWTQ
ncbi:tetratricopeptide repeat protein [Candidatus Dojkabacteria bacterium]|nr:tetratricopeptide repeat protein [Candidatus Dojkabacteria bacterium]